MSTNGPDTPHVPGPSLWPIGFAIGVACLLLGLVISWVIAVIGAVLAVSFGLLWARDVTRDVRGEVPEIRPETRAVSGPATPAVAVAEEPLPAYTRSRFLEASLIGLSGAMGAVLTLPVLGFMVLPSFTGVEEDEVSLGPLDNFPEGEYVIATYLSHPEQGEVSRRTAFVRNNGESEAGEQSFTILYSRCVHLGCPVQPNGPIDEDNVKKIKNVELRPVLAQSFGCPCHGGQYNSEGNRTAGPPVRSLDRYTFSIRNGNLVLGELYAVGNVNGTGANATISKYPWSVPGTHVDGLESWLYPIVPTQVTG
ncbi:MAG: Rieske 2Fe-2S domain-containing protein [Actinobacteria bacterium]|nr:Rieske 2Fe-2S domain-containing protein [Actinomycetota bacterium]